MAGPCVVEYDLHLARGTPPTHRELNQEFNHYLNIAKPMVMGLRVPSERIMAAHWLKRLLAETEADEEAEPSVLEKRNNYLKLLIRFTTYGFLSGPFLDVPSDEALPPLPTYQQVSAWEEILSRRVKNLGPPEPLPRVYFEKSFDRKIVGCVQPIPRFGVQAYLAVSDEPEERWWNARVPYWAGRPLQDSTLPEPFSDQSGDTQYSRMASPDSAGRLFQEVERDLARRELTEWYVGDDSMSPPVERLFQAPDRAHLETSPGNTSLPARRLRFDEGVEANPSEERTTVDPESRRMQSPFYPWLQRPPCEVPATFQYSSSVASSTATASPEGERPYASLNSSLRELSRALDQTQNIIKDALNKTV